MPVELLLISADEFNRPSGWHPQSGGHRRREPREVRHPRHGYLDGGPHHRGDGFFYPDEQAWRSEIDVLIGKSRKRGSGSQPASGLPPELDALIEEQLTVLRQRQHTCSDPFSCEQATRKKIAAMLPEAQVLDRLLRYETHADRSLHRALETLAKLRGATVETLMATVTGPTPDGGSATVRRERTTWTPAGPSQGL